MVAFVARMLLAVGAPTLLAGLGLAQERGLQKIAEPAGGSVTLSVHVQARSGTVTRTLRNGDSLKTGDLIEFAVAVDNPAFVYAIQYFPDGSAQVLHPEVGEVRLAAGQEVRIPDPGSWFQLVGTPGEERIYFVASTRPLHDVDERVAEAVKTIRLSSPGADANPSGGQGAAPKPTVSAKTTISSGPRPAAVPPPTAFGLGTRGRLVKVTPTAAEPRDGIVSDASGVAIYEFLIRHQASR